MTGGDPAQLWAFYLQLTEVEQAFKELKDDLAIRPIYHQTDARIEAHIFIAFLLRPFVHTDDVAPPTMMLPHGLHRKSD